nr:reverse transcriptase domain, reverse transcriptase zinc-binding domain protein [Tanacetum cinerariifolium]
MLRDAARDKLIWIDRKGKQVDFSIRKVWNDLNETLSKVQDRLLTQDRILKWKPNDVLLIMNKKLPQKWRDITMEFSQIKDCNNIWSILRRMVCRAAIYYIWQERKARIFGNAKRDENVLCQEIKDTIKMRLISLLKYSGMSR